MTQPQTDHMPPESLTDDGGFLLPSFGPAHPCHLCGVEVQMVERSYGRRGYEETATGLHHSYHCTGNERAVATMLAKVMQPEYMPESPAPPAAIAPPKPSTPAPYIPVQETVRAPVRHVIDVGLGAFEDE